MEFLLFSKSNCIWCTKAKALFNEGKLYFEEYVYPDDFTKEHLLSQLGLSTNSKLTLPQIFLKTEVGITHIGGFQELKKYVSGLSEI